MVYKRIKPCSDTRLDRINSEAILWLTFHPHHVRCRYGQCYLYQCCRRGRSRHLPIPGRNCCPCHLTVNRCWCPFPGRPCRLIRVQNHFGSRLCFVSHPCHLIVSRWMNHPGYPWSRCCRPGYPLNHPGCHRFAGFDHPFLQNPCLSFCFDPDLCCCLP
jgi:hypothetical protein